MKLNRPQVAALYLVATLLILVPLSEAVLSVWPVRAGAASWRFGAAGLFSRALMTPLLGLMIASGTAHLLGHRRILRSLAVVGALGAIMLFLQSGLFALDAFEIYGRVRPDARSAFILATLQALLKLVAAMVVLALVMIGNWRASARRVTQRAQARVRAPMMSDTLPAGAIQA